MVDLPLGKVDAATKTPTARRTEQAGFRDHLVKPVDIRALDGLDPPR
jgi:hypothetical protein